MPLYEYRCLKCGQLTELLQKLSDPPLERCPTCRGKVEKLVSRTSFHLKGGGWYAQGYGSSGSAAGSGTSGEGSDKKSEKGKPDKSEGSGASESSGAKKKKKAAAAGD